MFSVVFRRPRWFTSLEYFKFGCFRLCEVEQEAHVVQDSWSVLVDLPVFSLLRYADAVFIFVVDVIHRLCVLLLFTLCHDVFFIKLFQVVVLLPKSF